MLRLTPRTWREIFQHLMVTVLSNVVNTKIATVMHVAHAKTRTPVGSRWRLLGLHKQAQPQLTNLESVIPHPDHAAMCLAAGGGGYR